MRSNGGSEQDRERRAWRVGSVAVPAIIPVATTAAGSRSTPAKP
jgi:hypothetical protein